MLGTDLCQELRKAYKVIGIDLAEADITKKSEIGALIKKISPDIVVHTAAYTDVDGCELDPEKAYKINSDGTKSVALACRAVDAILIYISTDFVFDGKKNKPYIETDKVNPLGIYADSKLKGEEAIKKILKKYFILRTSWLYGKHGKNFVDTIIAKAKSEKVLRVVNDQIGSPTYTKDLAKAIHKIATVIARPEGPKQSQYGTYHISNSGSISWFDYAREILSLARSKTKVVPISSQELARPAKRPAMSVLDNSKFNRLTGYRMRNWQEALKSYV